MREVFITNAPTFLDECRDPDALQMDLDALASFDKPALLSSRTENTPFFGPVVDIIASRIPGSDRITTQGANHVPQISMPDRYVELVMTFANTERAIESRLADPAPGATADAARARAAWRTRWSCSAMFVARRAASA